MVLNKTNYVYIPGELSCVDSKVHSLGANLV